MKEIIDAAVAIGRTSRRDFLRNCTTAALCSAPVLRSWAAGSGSIVPRRGPAQGVLSLDEDWLFGGKLRPGILDPGFDDAAFERINLPHTVTPLSWQKWSPDSWQDIWVYRKHFRVPPEFRGLRLFLCFDRVLAAANPSLNGRALPQHLGGFLPFEYEITNQMSGGDNLLSVAVDARWLNIPPSGSPKGPNDIDYLLPGGITGHVKLRAVPSVFLSDVFAKPVSVLDRTARRLDVTCRINCAAPQYEGLWVEATLFDRDRAVAKYTMNTRLNNADEEIRFSIGKLENVDLWEPDRPRLYDLEVTLHSHEGPQHTYRTRIGFREAHFDVDGFFLNGRRTRIFGLNRHELYPYVGFAAPDRLMRRDAEILRKELNCNTVRCSHYPQSEAFLDACDELGLMVWEEIPGWQYLGDKSWQDLVIRDVEAMVRRDRNHPSIIIWGVRINESPNNSSLYRRTRDIAKSLDDSRPTSGSMTPDSIKEWRQEWHQDVFAFDDYHVALDGSVGIEDPLPGVPYMVAETVGQFDYSKGKDFDLKYRRAGDPVRQVQQALLHAQAHDKGAANPRCAGVIAWCAFDYASLMNASAAVKCPGIADVFRIPKLGASFYLAQVDPAERLVIEPDFYWDFGPRTPSGPGKHSAIFSNCDRLELFLDGKHYAAPSPDRAGFPNTKYPPFFVDLEFSQETRPELRIHGYAGGKLVAARSFSADRFLDRLWLEADDSELQADGSDATRLAFGAIDRFGAPRPFVEGDVHLHVQGPGIIVGDNPFSLNDAGGRGAVWIKTVSRRRGAIMVTAEHAVLGRGTVRIESR